MLSEIFKITKLLEKKKTLPETMAQEKWGEGGAGERKSMSIIVEIMTFLEPVQLSYLSA